MTNDFSYKILKKDEAFALMNDLRNVGIASYGVHAAVLAPEHAETLNNNMHREETWLTLLGHATCFVCMNNNQIIGMAYLVPRGNPWQFFEAEWSYIRMVGVLPEYGGNGIGRKLTKMCIDHARELNEQIIALHTSEFMHAARHIYESLGFTILKEIGPRLGKQYWIYTLDLNQS